MFGRKTLVAVAALLVLPRAAHAQLKVLATVPDLAAVASAIGPGLISIKAMSLPTQDAHFVDAKPSLALELNKADLLLAVGLDLEIGWLPTLLVGARNGNIQPGSRGYLDCSQFVRRLDVPAHPVDRTMGDIHPGGNPHYMTDPRAVASVARGIADRLVELDGGHAATYRANLAAFLKKLEAARKGWEAKFASAPYRGAPFISYHKTLTYLADWLGLEEAGFLEPKPGIPPNPTHVAQLLGQSRIRKVRALVQEEKYPDTTSTLVAKKIPAALVRIPGGVNFQGGQSYVAYMDQVVDRIAAGLKSGGQ
jgi:zinc/manganese transport system substrate-binding protein